MRPTLGVLLAVAGAVLCFAKDGEAQTNVQGQATFTASVGVTDNVLQAPDRDPDTPIDDTTLFPEWDGLVTLTPGVVLIFERPASTHSLGYSFGVTFFFQHSEANAFTHNLVYANQIPLSDTVSLNTGLGATFGQQSNFNRVNRAQNQVIQPQTQQPGDDLFVSVFANEGLSKEFSPDWVGTQVLGVSHFRPFNEQLGNSWIVQNALTLNRLFEYDIVGVQLGVDYARFSALENPDTGDQIQPVQRELTTRPAVIWQHQFAEEIASTLTLGIVHSMDATAAFSPTEANDDPRHIVQPYGVGSLGYANPRGAAALTYSHNVGPNVFLNTVAVTDTIQLTVGVPLGRLPINWDAGGGFSWVRQIGEDDSGDAVFGAAQRIATVDTGLTYVPPQYPSLNVGARYLFTKQLAPSSVPPELEGQQAFGFTQNTLLFSVGVVFPDQVEGNAQVLSPAPFQPVPSQNPDILRPTPPPSAQPGVEDDPFGAPPAGSGEEE